MLSICFSLSCEVHEVYPHRSSPLNTTMPLGNLCCSIPHNRLLNTLSLFLSLRWMCRTSVASKIFMVLIACSRIQRRHQTLLRIPKTISIYHPWHSTIIFCKTTLSFHLHNVSSDAYILM